MNETHPRLPDSLPKPDSERELTPQQLRVIAERTRHDTIKQAAAALGITENTAKNHLSQAYARLGVSSIVGAFRVLGWFRVPGDEELVAMSDALSAANTLRDAIDEGVRVLGRRDQRPALLLVAEPERPSRLERLRRWLG